MRDDDPNLKVSEDKPESSGVSRRDFLKISGISVAVPLVAGPQTVLAAGEEVPVHGPGKVPMEFTINGKSYKANLEPRVTLLDALRDEFELTGAKRVCDRAECGACTVLMENKPVYACSVLAIEAQRKPITTVETPCSRLLSTTMLPSAASALPDSLSPAKLFLTNTRSLRPKMFGAALAGICAAAVPITAFSRSSRRCRRKEPELCRITHGPMRNTAR